MDVKKTEQVIDKDTIDTFTQKCQPLSELLESVRNIEGFPLGEDEDILALSNTPYYTACPNPYISNFVKRYGKTYNESTDTYKRTPFVGDVSEGKNDPIYNAHSYHTKVPHKAIMKYIEHYTEPGDIVFDGFCGTGMTGVAAQTLGRYAVLSDLSPIASFISYNYNTSVNINDFEREINRILNYAQDECSWVYDTLDIDGRTQGKINYVIWSNVLICPYCNKEYNLWDVAIDAESGELFDEYECIFCKAILTKNKSDKAVDEFYDDALGHAVRQVKQIPVFIYYTVKGSKKILKKKPDQKDFDLIEKIAKSPIANWYPVSSMMNKGVEWGDTWRAGYHFGITHVHHFYTRRNLLVLSFIYGEIVKCKDVRLKNYMLLFFTSLYSRSHKMNRYMPKHHRHVGPLSGTLYLSFFQVEINIFNIAEEKKKRFLKLNTNYDSHAIIGVSSLTNVSNIIPDEGIDYIFTDPPFGDNLMYSELNYIWESWLKVTTNIKDEAIINNSQGKDLNSYKELMINGFRQCYRILKPNRWITVEFHNSRAAVWNIIQESLTKAGFIIAQVAIIDKQKGTTKQLTYANAVQNDLVINAYKPKKQFEYRFLQSAGEGLEIEFIAEHLRHLPVEPNIQRTEQMVFAKMLVYYIQHGYEINMNAKTFYELLWNNFFELDGYWFTEEQVKVYEETKKTNKLDQKEICGGILFIDDEKTAIAWLNLFLFESKTYSDISKAFNQALIVSEDNMPDLRQLLEENFVSEAKMYRRPIIIEKQEMEERRSKRLLKHFEIIFSQAKSGNKLKEIRKDVIIMGFTQCYRDKRFEDILTVAKKLPPKLIETSSEIYDYIDIAEAKMSKM